MLKRNKSSKKSSSNSNPQKSSTNAPSITLITESTQVTANLYCEDDLRIAGSFTGEIKSKKKVMLSESGIINGSVDCPEADISGKITGDINAANTLILRASAVVEGKVITKKLTIENGAQIKGSFNVGPNVSIPKVEIEEKINPTK